MWLHYVYIHFRKSDGVPFYVGKGTSRSKGKNIYARARAFHSTNLHWERTVEKHGLVINVIMSCQTDEEARAQEQRVISEIGRQDLGTGTLVNMTDGGDGVCGRIVSSETRARLSSMFKGRPLSEEWRNAVRAARRNGGNGSVNGKLPAEWARNIGLAHTGSKNHFYGKTTAIARKVVDSATGTIYPSVSKAAEDFKLNMKTLYNMLSDTELITLHWNFIMKISDPSTVVIEKVAAEMAGVFYDAARSSGMKLIQLQGKTINLLRYKSARDFARRHIEAFIPAAVHSLIEIMSRDTTPEPQKRIIYDAIMERANDKDLDMIAKTAGDMPSFENTVLYKADTEKPKPVIINTPKIDFDFNSKRV